MKKFLMVLALVAILATGTAFADHPDGFGIGLVGSYGIGWGGAGGGLSLKIPGVPLFWAINLGLGSDHFGFGITGDYYLIDDALPVPTLHWFLGVGGFFNFYTWSSTYYSEKYSYSNLSFGLRVPIGLSWQPIDLLEIFLDIAPSLGVYIDGDGKYTYAGTEYVWHKGGAGFHWGVPLEIGFRLWF